MPQQSKPGPDPSSSSATGALRPQLDDFRFETDFTELAERFSALSGGGFSPEISADLALEVVLNEIVERACGATGATGAAIVLWRDGELVCRASSGHTAPEMGARLDTTSGISGACIKAMKTQRCDDVLADPRADIEASYRLGVRSVIVMPLLQREKLLGLFELLSSLPSAFEERDELVMEALASRALSNLERASQPLPAPAAARPTLKTLERAVETRDNEDKLSRRRSDWVTWLLGAAVVSCAVLLGILVAQHFIFKKRAASAVAASSTLVRRPAVSPAAASANPVAATNIALAASRPLEKKADNLAGSPHPSEPAKPNLGSAVPPGGLLVSQGSKEIFRMQPGDNTPPAQEQVTVSGEKNVVELSPAEAEDSLVERIEPDYPQQARDMGVQGAVVLTVEIKADGSVEDVRVVSGPAQLVAASVVAVKRWRFKPHVVGGHPKAMQTTVTLNFVLPQP